MTILSSPRRTTRHCRGRRHIISPAASSLSQNPGWLTLLQRRRRVTCLLVWLLSLLGLVLHMGVVLRWSVRFQSLQQLLPAPVLVSSSQSVVSPATLSTQLVHVLHTRLWHHETATQELEHLARAQFHVFQTWTLPSVLQQSNANVTWIIWIDPATPRDWTQRLVTLLQDHHQHHKQQTQPQPQKYPQIVVVASRVADIPPLRSSFYQPRNDGITSTTTMSLEASLQHDSPQPPSTQKMNQPPSPQSDLWYSRGLPASSIVHGSRASITDLWQHATRDNGTVSIVLETVLEADQAISYNWVDTIQKDAWQSLGQRTSSSTSSRKSKSHPDHAASSHRRLRDYRYWCAPQVLVWQHDGSHPNNHHYQQQQHTGKKNKKNKMDSPENLHPSSATGRFHVWNYAKKRPPTHAHPERDLEDDDDKPHSVDSRIVPSTASYLTTCPTGAFTIGYGVGTWPHHLPTSSSTRSSNIDRVRGDETDAEPLSLSWSFSSENPPTSSSHGKSTKTTLLSRSQVVRQLPPCEFVQFQCWSRMQSGTAAQVAVVRAMTLASSSVRSMSAMGGKRRGNRHSNKDKNNNKDNTRTNQDPPWGWSWLLDTFGVEQSHVQALDRALSRNLRNIVLDRLQQEEDVTAHNKQALLRVLHELPPKKDSTDLTWSLPEYDSSSRNPRMMVLQTEPQQQQQRHSNKWWWNPNSQGKKDKTTSLDHSLSFHNNNNNNNHHHPMMSRQQDSLVGSWFAHGKKKKNNNLNRPHAVLVVD